ncbi:hypothetical protein LTS12_027039, partial [Elasticomyces elasticus]
EITKHTHNMLPSEEIGWLDIGVGEGATFTLLDHGRLERVIAELTEPGSQCPALCVFLGTKWKDTSLRHLYPHNNIKRRDSEAAVRLRYDIGSWGTSRPIFLADGDLSCKPYPRSSERKHIKEEQSIMWDKPSTKTVLHAVWARLVFHFADIICIFADDFPDLSHVAEFLIDCLKLGSASSLPVAVRPRVIIVLGNVRNGGSDDVQQADLLYRRLNNDTSRSLSESFSAVNMIRLEDGPLSETACHERLRALIAGQLDDMQLVRQDHNVLINANHLEALFRSAFRHLADEICQPFHYVKATRAYNSVPPSLATHLMHYQEIGMQTGLCYEDLVPSIASALIMDHYIPGMLSV